MLTHARIVLADTPTSLASSEALNIEPILPAHNRMNVRKSIRSFTFVSSLTSRSIYVFIYAGYMYLGRLRFVHIAGNNPLNSNSSSVSVLTHPDTSASDIGKSSNTQLLPARLCVIFLSKVKLLLPERTNRFSGCSSTMPCIYDNSSGTFCTSSNIIPSACLFRNALGSLMASAFVSRSSSV